MLIIDGSDGSEDKANRECLQPSIDSKLLSNNIQIKIENSKLSFIK